MNEPLVLHFSEELDRTSVTSQSVRIRGPDGRAARGRLRVDRSTITFEPALPTLPDLSDGGFRPDRRYELELVGFPRPDGIRSRSGAPLARTEVRAFRTAGSDGPFPLFVDPLAPLPYPLVPERTDVAPLESISLECGEALDPTSLSEEDFQLLSLEAGPASGDVVRLRPRLVENRRDRARLELLPLPPQGAAGVYRVLSPGTWYLAQPGGSLRSLGRRPVRLLSRQPVRIQVRERPLASETIRFDRAARARAGLRGTADPSGYAGEHPELWYGESPGFDGTAYWDEPGGVLTVRYPAAAGDGRDGEVLLQDSGPLREEARQNDLHAVRLVLPAEAVVALGALPGAIVLRSQGPLEVHGTLRRRSVPAEAPLPAFVAGRTPGLPAVAAAVARLAGAPRSLSAELARILPGRWTLSEWLERARASDEPWTVLVAGGDLRVSGRIETDGPLLLAAGGWIRVDGRIDAPEIWKTPGGGENLVRVRELPLRIDPPLVNPLIRPLSVGISTVPIRPPRGVFAWNGVETVGADGAGNHRVEFLVLRDRPDGGVDTFGPLTELGGLQCDAVRLLVGFDLAPGSGEAWNPPELESVRLEWTEPLARAP